MRIAHLLFRPTVYHVFFWQFVPSQLETAINGQDTQCGRQLSSSSTPRPFLSRAVTVHTLDVSFTHHDRQPQTTSAEHTHTQLGKISGLCHRLRISWPWRDDVSGMNSMPHGPRAPLLLLLALTPPPPAAPQHGLAPSYYKRSGCGLCLAVLPCLAASDRLPCSYSERCTHTSHRSSMSYRMNRANL